MVVMFHPKLLTDEIFAITLQQIKRGVASKLPYSITCKKYYMAIFSVFEAAN